MPAGRPSKKDSIDMKQMKKLFLAGWTDRQVADFFEVTEQTLNNWKQDEKFFESLKGWKEIADHRVEESLYRRAIGYTHEHEEVFQYQGVIITHKTMKVYPADTTACIFWLKNRKQKEWRDKIDDEKSDDRLNSELDFVGVPTKEKNGRFERYYN